MISLTTSFSLHARDADTPDMALLEFIGESVSVGDELVDPVNLQAMQETPIGQLSGPADAVTGKVMQKDKQDNGQARGTTGNE